MPVEIPPPAPPPLPLPPLPPPLPLPLPPAPLPDTHKGQQAYLPPGAANWLPLTVDACALLRMDEAEPESLVRSSRAALADMFSSALQVPNLGFFAGSGTSLGDAGGPSMWKLWQDAMCQPRTYTLTPRAEKVAGAVRYAERNNPNIEHFLSQCDAYLSFNDDPAVSSFVAEVKALILTLCSEFITLPTSDISAYRDLLQKLARRRVRDPRLKVFTTNYDMCFETAASELGMIAIDGFSYSSDNRSDGARAPAKKLHLMPEIDSEDLLEREARELRSFSLLKSSAIELNQAHLWIDCLPAKGTGDRYWSFERTKSFEVAVEQRAFSLYTRFYQEPDFQSWALQAKSFDVSTKREAIH